MTTIESSKFIEIQLETIKECPICGSKRHHKWCDGYDRLHRISSQCFIYHRCDSCGLVFLAVRPKEEDIFKFYPEEYQPYQTSLNSNSLQNGSPEKQGVGQRKIVKAANKLGGKIINLINGKFEYLFPYKVPSIIQKFYKPPSPGLKLLDFGCGSSSFLNKARDNGWQTLGADFSPGVVDRVITDGHEAFLVNSQNWQSIKTQSIDFVRMSHVLEHLYSPIEILQDLDSKLKKGGLLHIVVPNPVGLSSLIFRSYWRGLDCPRHVMLYSPLLLKKILSDLKFGDFQILHEKITKDFLGSYGYLLCDRGKIDYAEAKEMIRRSDLASLINLPVKLAAALGKADTYHIFARKL